MLKCALNLVCTAVKPAVIYQCNSQPGSRRSGIEYIWVCKCMCWCVMCPHWLHAYGFMFDHTVWIAVLSQRSNISLTTQWSWVQNLTQLFQVNQPSFQSFSNQQLLLIVWSWYNHHPVKSAPHCFSLFLSLTTFLHSLCLCLNAFTVFSLSSSLPPLLLWWLGRHLQ